MAASPLPMVIAARTTKVRLRSARILISAFAEFAFAGEGAREDHVRNGDERKANQRPPEPGIHEAPDDGDDEIHEAHREHEFPGEAHELIHAQAGQGAANPDEEAD